LSLDEFRIPVDKSLFDQIVDKDILTIINRETTKHGSPITSSFNLNYEEINQAVLKVNLLADKGRILDFIPNEFKLNSITVNGKRFTPSDIRNSVNIIDKSNASRLNRILNAKGENQISVDFSAPIGAGVVSPDAEVTAILIINGKKSVLPALPNTNQIIKNIKSFVSDTSKASLPFLILIAVIFISIALVVLKVKK